MMRKNFMIAHRRNGDFAEFRARFWRFYKLQHFIATRVLGGPERADDAIENCWRRASRNPQYFEYEGAFRSWLVRILIEEALGICRENQVSSQDTLSLEEIPTDMK